MGKKKSMKYNSVTGNYGYLTNTQLQKIELPKFIKCDLCKKSKSPEAYSKARQAEVRAAIYRQGREHATYAVLCGACSGNGQSELECIVCKEWKDIGHFAKAQRKDRDNATCLSCMDERTSFDPVHLEAPSTRTDSDNESDYDYSDVSDDLYSDDDDDTSEAHIMNYDNASISTNLDKLSIAETDSGSVSSIGSSRLASTLFSSLNAARMNTAGGVPLSSGRASGLGQSHVVPRSRIAVSTSAESSYASKHLPRAGSHNSNNAEIGAAESTGSNGHESSTDSDAESNDSIHGNDLEDDEFDKGPWRGSNAVSSSSES
ncbi:uncharacterized protein PV09_02942 [Verruconis gallopava]|uniref:Stc1 domain-containing protein n=1 Tax=Verruconis gallopava TaxID=253628 RepID=A0A0D2B5N8_9PEZI|nr:uncharacterized protein PV09_02942 [Verruconis gallopava]KIW06509.1 hypothetical protein PV09_02942 [Verruconis gallopava]